MNNKNLSMVKNSNNNISISLSDWISIYHSEKEIRELFLNIDKAMKFVHNYGFCIKSFYPKDIEILNNSLSQIRFKTLLELPNDFNLKKKYIKEDIYNSSFIQIGIYSKCLNYLQRDFLENNFDSFSSFLPSTDIPYYRGVIERGASVYLCEYDTERRKRELINLEKEIGATSSDINKVNSLDIDINDNINSIIYRQIIKKKDAAYINFLVYPVIILTLLIVFAIIVRILCV